jgi:hypothetical protein
LDELPRAVQEIKTENQMVSRDDEILEKYNSFEMDDSDGCM